MDSSGRQSAAEGLLVGAVLLAPGSYAWSLLLLRTGSGLWDDGPIPTAVSLPLLVVVVAFWGVSLGWWNGAILLGRGPLLPVWLWACGVFAGLACARSLLRRGRHA